MGRTVAAIAIVLTVTDPVLAAPPSVPSAPQPAAASAPVAAPEVHDSFDRLERRSWNPLNAYRGVTVPAPNLDNSPRLDTLVRDGKLYLSLRDAIDLALENNLDIVIARYNLPIAQADILRTSAGG
ncbi:MAG TPA: hypothetical protein VN682_15410, partial [Terriglobales bacterium]|nr:hypothetical protein [Terriglobales bacterium]